MNDITRLNRADAVAALRAALGQLTGAKTQRRAAALADAVEAEAHDGPRFPTATALAVFEGAPDPDDSFKEFRREFGQQVKKAGGDTTLWLDGAGHACVGGELSLVRPRRPQRRPSRNTRREPSRLRPSMPALAGCRSRIHSPSTWCMSTWLPDRREPWSFWRSWTSWPGSIAICAAALSGRRGRRRNVRRWPARRSSSRHRWWWWA